MGSRSHPQIVVLFVLRIFIWGSRVLTHALFCPKTRHALIQRVSSYYSLFNGHPFWGYAACPIFRHTHILFLLDKPCLFAGNTPFPWENNCFSSPTSPGVSASAVILALSAKRGGGLGTPERKQHGAGLTQRKMWFQDWEEQSNFICEEQVKLGRSSISGYYIPLISFPLTAPSAGPSFASAHRECRQFETAHPNSPCKHGYWVLSSQKGSPKMYQIATKKNDELFILKWLYL